MKKKCTKCGEIKDLEKFGNNKNTKDRKESRCKKCKKKAAKERTYQLTCAKPDCGDKFTASWSGRKFCDSCTKKKLTFEDCELEAKKYRTKSDFEKNSKSAYQKALKNDWLSKITQHMETKMNYWTFEQCRDSALKCKTRKEFKAKFSSQYDKAYREKWLGNITKHMQWLAGTSWTFEQCRTEALKYETRSNFRDGSYGHYQKARKEGWLNEICQKMINLNESIPDDEIREEMGKYSSRSDFEKKNSSGYSRATKRDWYKEYAQELWGDPIQFGFSRSEFIEVCERNNNGKGILYLIRCWMGDEIFYKIGITSLSVEERYNHDGSSPIGRMPYFYKLVWKIEEDASEIWDLELQFKRNIKDTKYQPEIKFGGSVKECFKCHGNCKILRKPEIK